MAIYIPGPSGDTWAEARAKVRGDLWRPGNSLPDDTVDRALHASCLKLEREAKWVWLENLSVLQTVNYEVAYLDLAPTIRSVTSIGIRRGTSLDGLTQRPLEVVRVLAESSVGDPSAWAFTDNRIYFDATLPAETVLELVLTARTPELLVDAIAAGSYTLHRQEQAVIAWACNVVALSFMKNSEEAQRQRTIYEDILEGLFDEEAERRGSNIQPDTWGNGRHG